MKRIRQSLRLLSHMSCLSATMLLIALSAQAQTDQVLPPLGGPGGGQYFARCPQGQYLAGFEAWVADDVDAIRPLCVAVYGPTQAGALEPYPTKFGGNGGSLTRQLLCPADAPIVTGIGVGYEGLDTQIVNNIHLFCGTATTTQVQSELPAAVFDGPTAKGRGTIAGGSFVGDAHITRQSCPTGLVAVGVRGRSGKWLDAVGLICGTPRPTANPVKPVEKKPSPLNSLDLVPRSELTAYIYAIERDGKLKWFRHDGVRAGTFNWQGPRVVNLGWSDFKQVFAGGDDTIYAITRDGVLMRYQHTGFSTGLGKDDAGGWLVPRKVASGWGNFKQVFSAGNGVIYAITQDGILQWYKRTELTNGNATFVGPRDVGRGWGDEKLSFSIGDGIIYSITRDGKLKWFRHNAYLTGAGLETPGSWEGPKEVGTGWSEPVQVFGIGNGFIYGITPAGKLMWYHHKGYRDGRVAWDGPVEVGHGWENLLLVFAQP